jgi:Zn-dependent alcohol dehydrogenase
MLPYLIEQHANANFPLDEIVSFYPVKDYGTPFKEIKDGEELKAVLFWNKQVILGKY